MSTSVSVAASWDRYYASSVTRVPYTDAVVFAMKVLARAPEASLLEFGCGNAQNLGFLRSVFTQARLIGCDVSEQGLIKAQALYPDLELFVNGDDLGLSPASLDAVIERAALQHVPKVLGQRYVAQMFEALKPGGTGFFEIANTQHGCAKLGDGGEDPVFGYRVFYDLGEIESLFAAFEIEQIFERKRVQIKTPEGTDRPVYDEACYQVMVRKPG